jgi:hypothetical protein
MASPRKGLVINKDFLVGLGEYLWRAVYPWTQGLPIGDRDLVAAFQRYVRTDPPATWQDHAIAFMLTTPAEQVELVSLYRFAEATYPDYLIGHKLAAALLVTGATKDAVSSARPPFGAFLIDVPEGMIEITGKDGKPDKVHMILATRLDSDKHGWTWAYRAYTLGGSAIYRWGVKSEQLLEPLTEEEAESRKFNPFELEYDDRDERAALLVGRLIINLCLMLSNPEDVKAKGEGHEYWKKRSEPHRRRQSSGQPRVRLFQLTTTVEHDFRPQVQAFARGERKSSVLFSQHIVSGHFKRQAHGPNRSLRKVIWVQPYPRGPKDAPFTQRTHKLEDEAPRAEAPRAEEQTPPSEEVADAIPWLKISRDPVGFKEQISESKPITNDRDLYDLLHNDLAKEEQEVFVVVPVDVRGQTRGKYEVHRGGHDRVTVDLAVVLRAVIAAGGVAFYVAHNHPSGNATPSEADRELTKSFEEAAAACDLVCVDHVVFGLNEYYSFADGKITKVGGERA